MESAIYSGKRSHFTSHRPGATGMDLQLSKDNLRRFALAAGMIAPFLLLSIITAVSLITPDYDPIKETISQMGTPDSRYAAWLNGGYILYGSLIGIGAFGFYRSLRSDPRAGLVAILLIIHAAGSILLAVFPDVRDVPGVAESKVNAHNLISTVTYLPLLGAILVFYLIARKTPSLRAVSAYGLVVIAASLPMPAITLVSALSPVCGLLQRMLYTLTSLWMALISWKLLRGTASPS